MPLSDGYTDVPAGRVAAVATYLEMTARPEREQAPDGAFTLRRVLEADPAWYKTLFREIGEEWLWFSRLRMSDDELRTLLRDPAIEVFALVHQGRDRGLLELDWRKPPDVELSFFGVARELIGARAGRFLIERAIEIAWSRNPARFWLHTCTLDHPRALEFYLRAGFRPYKRAIEIAPDPRLTGDLPVHAAPRIPIL